MTEKNTNLDKLSLLANQAFSLPDSGPTKLPECRKTLRSHGSACCTSKYRPIHVTPEKFENRASLWKYNKCFLSTVHTQREEFKNAAISVHFELVLAQNSDREFVTSSFWIRKVPFSKLNVFCSHKTKSRRFLNPSDWDIPPKTRFFYSATSLRDKHKAAFNLLSGP